MIDLSKVELVLFDLDGVLLVGKDEPQPLGGHKLIEKLRKKGIKIFILTNDTTDTRQEIKKKLERLGFSLELEEILSASHLTAKYIHERFSSTSCYMIGEKGFAQELKSFGHVLVGEQAKSAKVVAVGLDRQLSYGKLDTALRLLQGPASLVVCHRARVYMDAGGPRMGPGAIVKGLEYASKKRATAVGKPEALMFKMALKMHKCRPDRALMIGDQLETDVIGAKRLGIKTALVMSGVEDKESVKRSPYKPDLVIDRVDDLTRYL